MPLCNAQSPSPLQLAGASAQHLTRHSAPGLRPPAAAVWTATGLSSSASEPASPPASKFHHVTRIVRAAPRTEPAIMEWQPQHLLLCLFVWAGAQEHHRQRIARQKTQLNYGQAQTQGVRTGHLLRGHGLAHSAAPQAASISTYSLYQAVHQGSSKMQGGQAVFSGAHT